MGQKLLFPTFPTFRACYQERKRRVALLRRWVEAGPLSTLVDGAFLRVKAEFQRWGTLQKW